MREVLGLNLVCNKVKNFVGKMLKKSGEVLADGSPPPKKNFPIFWGFFHFYLCQVLMTRGTRQRIPLPINSLPSGHCARQSLCRVDVALGKAFAECEMGL